MSSKKWLYILAAAVLMAVCCCAAFNILIDPFGVFGDPVLDWYGYNETSNPGVAKLAWLDKHYGQYDSYIIGSSSAASYDVEELNGYLDASFYNLFVYDCDAKDYRDLAAYVLDNYTVKNIVLNLGIDEAVSCDEGEQGVNSRMHAKVSGRSLLQFYLEYSLTTAKQSLKKLAARHRDTELPQYFDAVSVDSGGYDNRVRDVEKIGDPAAYEAAHSDDFSDWQGWERLPHIAECVRMIADIRGMCAERGVNLTVIASPVYVGRWSGCDETALRDYKTALAGEVDYWDFSFTPISFDSRYFYDQNNFRSAVGSMVLAEIFGNDDVYRPERFGSFVTADNCQAYLDGLFADPPEPEADSYTVDVPALIYHYIGDSQSVTTETFEEQMRFLAENGYHAVSAREMIDYVCRGGELPENPVLITFDDGYLSNYENGWPALEKYGLKATVFAIGVSVGHDRYYKDTEFVLTPHFSYEQAREMIDSGAMDIQSHTFDMHQWPEFESGDRIRKNILPFEDESETEYMAALSADIELYNSIRREELGDDFIALAYPEGEYTTLTEVVVHQKGIALTVSTRTDSRNVLVRGLPQSLYALCRWNMTEDTAGEDMLAFLKG